MTLEATLAEAIANAFWETAEQPRHWSTMGENQREVFRICARRAIEAAAEFKKSRSRSQPSGAASTTHADHQPQHFNGERR